MSNENLTSICLTISFVVFVLCASALVCVAVYNHNTTTIAQYSVKAAMIEKYEMVNGEKLSDIAIVCGNMSPSNTSVFKACDDWIIARTLYLDEQRLLVEVKRKQEEQYVR